MIVWDTETTGLPKPLNTPMEQQPEIIEFAAVRLNDDTLEEEASVEILIKPSVLWPLPAEVTKMNGITNEMLEGQPTFAGVFTGIANFILGQRIWVAHNISFDLSMMTLEMTRLGRMARFPWPMEALCTVELTTDLSAGLSRTGRLKLAQLAKLATGSEPVLAHRALADVRTLATCVRWLRAKDGRI